MKKHSEVFRKRGGFWLKHLITGKPYIFFNPYVFILLYFRDNQFDHHCCSVWIPDLRIAACDCSGLHL